MTDYKVNWVLEKMTLTLTPMFSASLFCAAAALHILRCTSVFRVFHTSSILFYRTTIVPRINAK